MAEINKRIFLDEAGLKLYDELIKAYIDKENQKDQAASQEILESLAQLGESVSANSEKIQANAEAIEILNGDGEGSVKQTVSNAVAAVVAGAPEALDTLKELADWIANDETASAALVEKVAANELAITELQKEDASLKNYIDESDLAFYNSIGSIAEVSIKKLFLEKVEMAEDESITDALNNLKDNEMLILPEGLMIDEDIQIPNGAVIDANGAIFTGTVEVNSDADVAIENAIFAKPVVIK